MGNIKARHLCDDIGDVQHQGASTLWLLLIFEHAIIEKFKLSQIKKLVYKKVVGLNQIYNFVVQNFFNWGCFGTQIYGLNFEFQIFKIFKWPQMAKKV